MLLAMAPDDLVGRIEDVYVVATNASFTWVEARTCYVQRGHDGGGEVVKAAGFSGSVGDDRPRGRAGG